jgi:hypothetical protein
MKCCLLFTTASWICVLASSFAFAQQVNAERGAIAIRGNVSGSTVIIGIPPEQLAALMRQANDLTESQRKLISNLEGQLDLNQRQIRAALNILGETDVPSELLAVKLIEIAKQFKALRLTATTFPGDDPKVASLKAEVLAAVNAGELAEADALLTEIGAEQMRRANLASVDLADTFAQRGEVALARLRYAEAAQHFADAASGLGSNGI